MSDPASVRGYRPSQVAPLDEENDEREVVRLANLERYISRAQAGLPIFDDPVSVPLLPSFVTDSTTAGFRHL